jgi:hypothetical protein
MLKIKEIADHLGLSKSQARRRVKVVKDLVSEDSISRGDYNEILVKQDAFEILKQLEEYRKAGHTTKKAKEKIREDIGNGINSETSEPRQTDTIKHREANQSDNHQPRQTDLGLLREQYEERLAEKDERIRELQRDKQRLQEKNDTLEHRLLTGKTEKEDKNPYKGKSLWKVVKEWLQAPAS